MAGNIKKIQEVTSHYLPELLLVLLLGQSILAKYFLPENNMGNNNFFLEDDLFYYFEIAKNFYSTHHFSFDEITYTNGFHPLWQLILILFYGLTLLFG